MRSVSMQIEAAEMHRARQVDDRLTFGAIALSCSLRILLLKEQP